MGHLIVEDGRSGAFFLDVVVGKNERLWSGLMFF